MAKKAKMVVEIKGDKSNLDKVLAGAKAGVQSFGKSAVNGMKAVAATAVIAAGALAYGVKQAYDLGGEMVDLGAKTGIAADQLLILQQAGKDASLDDVTGSVNKLQAALINSVKNGTGPAAQALSILQLKGEELMKKNPIEQLEAIGVALRAIQSPELKTSITRDLFGRSGPDMLALLGNADAMKEAAAAVGTQARILRDNAAAFDAVSDRLGHAGLKLQGFSVGVAKGILPAMDAITKTFDKIDLAQKGQAFGNAIRPVLDELNAFLINWEFVMTKWSFRTKATIAEAANKIAAAVMGIPGFIKPPDFFGAKGYKGVANAMQGAQDAVTMMDPITVSAKAPWQAMNKTLKTGSLSSGSNALGERGFQQKFHMFGPPAPFGANGFGTSALSSSLSGGAYGQTPILPLRERRAFENARVANGENRDLRRSNSSAFNVVRSGDSRRAKNVAIDKAREDQKNMASNIAAIAKSSAETAEALKE